VAPKCLRLTKVIIKTLLFLFRLKKKTKCKEVLLITIVIMNESFLFEVLDGPVVSALSVRSRKLSNVG
jgi:hypothetical protein